jgi:iron complex outermembrane receptor protein
MLASTSSITLAQSAPGATQAPVEQANDTSTDILVTARRREETVQDVPIAVTAVGQQQLENQQIQDLEGLNLSVPNVTIVRNTGTTTGAQVYIRGVGADDSSFTGEPPIGLYLDDVYVGREIGGMLDILDFDRIEVLRGPQGTLYGRNSSGGAIKYVTRRPDLDELHYGGAVSVGSYDRVDVNVTGSIPLDPGTFAIKIDGGSRSQRGWAHIVDATGTDTGRRANGIDSQAARISALWSPTESLKVYANVDLERNRSGPQAIISTNCTGVVTATTRCPYRFGPRETGFGAPDINRFIGGGGNLTIEYDTGKGTLRSITGYRQFSDDTAIDLSGNPAAPFNLVQYLRQHQISEEAQFASDFGGWFDVVAGLYYFHERIRQNAVFTGFRNIDAQDADSYAAYAEAYLRPIDRLTITLGGRISHDKKSIDRQFFNSATATTPTVVLNDQTGNNTFSDTKFTPKVGVDFKVTPDVLLYASWSKGYRAGGFAAARPTSVAQVSGTVASETVDSYETGFKTELFNRLLRLNGDVFLSKYHNLQSSVLGSNGSFSVISGDAKFYGGELEAYLHPTRGFNIYGILGLLHDEWTRKPLGAGDRLKHVPRRQFKIGADYTTPITENISFYINGNYRWSSEIFRNVANTPNIISPSYGLLDGAVGIGAPDGKWKLTFSAENLTDKIYVTQGVSTLGRYLGEPRTFAVNFKLAM